MKTAIMQPYFFPYIGYFQLIKSVDLFIIYDNIQYSKKGWVNRNRILKDNNFDLISLPLKKDSDFLNIDERFLSDNWRADRIKLINKIKEAYRKAPYYEDAIDLIERCLFFENTNLFSFLHNSIKEVLTYLSITTQVIISSDLKINHNLKAEKKVIEICKKVDSKIYVNPEGGISLYDKENFSLNGIELKFLVSKVVQYKQFGDDFLPFLSIIDVIMFNSKQEINEMLLEFDLL